MGVVYWDLDIARLLREMAMLAVVGLWVWVIVEERRLLSHYLGMVVWVIHGECWWYFCNSLGRLVSNLGFSFYFVDYLRLKRCCYTGVLYWPKDWNARG
jgi:hypothetical protein